MSTSERILIILTIWVAGVTPFAAPVVAQEPDKGTSPKRVALKLSLQECLDIALDNNRRRKVSQSAVEIAEAQHQQALSAWWPQVKASMSLQRLSQDPNFVFPSETMNFNLMGVQQSLVVPQKDIKLFDRDVMTASGEITYPIFTGGRRLALSKQAKLGVKVAEEAARRTDIEVVYDVKRMYYGLMLAMDLRRIAQDTLERFEMTLKLTEHMYQHGSGRVKKTDYLRTKVIVSSIRSMLALLESNQELARAALVNCMGLNWQTQVEVSDTSIPFLPFGEDLTGLVNNAYQFNPDWSQLRLGLKIADARVKEAVGRYFPVVAIFGSLDHYGNEYSKGLMTNNNRDSWTVGVGIEMPLFTGFRTTNQVREAKARLEKLKHEEVLLREGIALQVRDALLRIARAQGQVAATKESVNSARENRELNVRAYQDELVETRDVIEAQILESFINAQYTKALHDHVVNRAKLDFVVGYEMRKLLQEG